MDLDQDGSAQHEPAEPKLESPQTAAEGAGMEVDDDAQEPGDPRMSLTNGPSVGVQSDRVVDLGPETSVLTVPQRNVLHTAWSPTDPHLLAVAGDALCRIWTATSPGPPPGRPRPNDRYVDLIEPGDESVVTAMAWHPTGEFLAVATRNDDTELAGEISLWSKSGQSMDNLPAARDMLIAFKWNRTGTYLLGITSSGRGSSALMIWDIRSSQALPPFQLDHVVTDAVWCDDDRFIVSGHSLIAECFVDAHNGLFVHHREEKDLHHNWTYVCYDSITQTAAIAAEDSGTLTIMSADGQIHTTTAHTAEITATAFEPVPDWSSYYPHLPRRLATASLNGDIRVWDVTKPFSILHALSLGRGNPVMAISFSPDGHHFAAANTNRVLFWNAQTDGAPRAVWRGDSAYMDGDSGIGEEDEGCTHSLSWDAKGGHLAYGTGSQVRDRMATPNDSR